MKQGSVLVYVVTDQGSCVETVDQTVSLCDPPNIKPEVIHHTVPLTVVIVPNTPPTQAITNATSSYILTKVKTGFSAFLKGKEIATGVNVHLCKLSVAHWLKFGFLTAAVGFIAVVVN